MKTNIIKKTIALLLALLTIISLVPASTVLAITSISGDPVEITEQQGAASSAVRPAADPGEVEYEAVSGTYNIVGQVLANAFNTVGEDPEKRAETLETYPTEEHEPSFYEGTGRIRYLRDGGKEPNYLVYRDSFLIIPEEETANYTIEYSDDGLIACGGLIHCDLYLGSYRQEEINTRAELDKS